MQNEAVARIPPANSTTRQTPRLSLRNPQPAALALSRSTVIVWRDPFLTTDCITRLLHLLTCAGEHRDSETHIYTHACTLTYTHIDTILFITRFGVRITIISFVS